MGLEISEVGGDRRSRAREDLGRHFEGRNVLCVFDLRLPLQLFRRVRHESRELANCFVLLARVRRLERLVVQGLACSVEHRGRLSSYGMLRRRHGWQIASNDVDGLIESSERQSFGLLREGRSFANHILVVHHFFSYYLLLHIVIILLVRDNASERSSTPYLATLRLVGQEVSGSSNHFAFFVLVPLPGRRWVGHECVSGSDPGLDAFCRFEVYLVAGVEPAIDFGGSLELLSAPSPVGITHADVGRLGQKDVVSCSLLAFLGVEVPGPQLNVVTFISLRDVLQKLTVLANSSGHRLRKKPESRSIESSINNYSPDASKATYRPAGNRQTA